MMIAPTVQQARCKAWIDRHLPPGGRVSVSDVTSMYTAICIMGPFTRIMLSELTDTDLSPKSFPFFTCKVRADLRLNEDDFNCISCRNWTWVSPTGSGP